MSTKVVRVISVLLLVVCGSAPAEVLTFDDVNAGTMVPIPDGYGNLNWDNFYVLDAISYGDSGYRNGLVSGRFVAYNTYADPALVFDSLIDFRGTYLTAAWRTGLNIKVEGYRGAALVYTRTVVVDCYQPTWFDFNYNNIDKLRFSSSGGNEAPGFPGSGEHFAMDNFMLGPPDPLNITPLDDFFSSGNVGGPFGPQCKTYTLTNSGPNTIDWSASPTQPWVSVTPSGGTLTGGATVNVDVCIDAQAGTLAAGIYNDTVTLTNLTSGHSQSRRVKLTIGHVATLPFIEDFESGAFALYWKITGTNNYRTQVTGSYGPHSGYYHATMDSRGGYARNELTLTINLADYENIILTFWAKEFNDEYDGPPPTPFYGGYDFDGVAISEDGNVWYEVQDFAGLSSSYRQLSINLDNEIAKYGLSYNAGFKIRFNQYDNYDITTDGIAVDDIHIVGTLKDDLQISPVDDFISSGDEGGTPEPFIPDSKEYTLRNIGSALLDWDVSWTADWLDVEPNSGALLPGDSCSVIVSLNDKVYNLPPGDYNDILAFENITSSFIQTRDMILTVNRVPGEIEVDTNALDFNDVIVGLSRILSVTIANVDPNYELTIDDIYVGTAPGRNQLFAIRDNYNGTYVIDTNTGVPTLIGPSGVTSSTCGLAHSGGDVLYGSIPFGLSIIEVDGNGVIVRGTLVMEGMAYDESTDTLYAAINGQFFTVDIATGQKLMNLPGWADDVEGLAFVPSVGSQGSVYGIDDDGDLYRYDVALGTITFINDTGLPSDNSGLAYAPDLDVLFHITKNSGDLYRIDKDTGVAAFVANTGLSGFSGLAYGPGSRIQVYTGGEPIPLTESSDDPNNIEDPNGELLTNTYSEDGIALNSEENENYIYLNFSPQDAEGFRLEGLPPERPIVLLPGGSLDVNVVFEPTEFQEYDATMVILSDDRDEAQIEVTLHGIGILDYLEVTPEDAFEFSGHPGGPFVPSNTTYELRNNGPISINWTVQVPTWLDGNLTAGTLVLGESVLVTFAPNAEADKKPEGHYTDWLVFSNTTTGKIHQREIILNVYTNPKIWFRPQSFDVTLPQGTVVSDTLTIGNTGDSNLTYELSSRMISMDNQLSAVTSAIDSNVSEEDGNRAVCSVPADHDFTVIVDEHHASGKLLVRFAPLADRSWPNTARKKAVLNKFGITTINREYKIVPGLCLVKLQKGMKIKTSLVSLNNSEDILYAEPDYAIKLESDDQLFPNDPYFPSQWALHNTGQSGGVAEADVNGPEAWSIRTDCSTVIVAVLDTGIDYTHQDLASNMWINEAEFNGTPGVDDDGNGYIDDIYGYDFSDNDSDPMDYHYHGTHVAGTIGAIGDNTTGVTGVCWDAKVMSLKVFPNRGDVGFISDVIEAIQYAKDKGAKVLSNSWGGGAYSQSLKDAIEAANTAGMLFIASAGNNGRNCDLEPHYPSSHNCDNVIAVMSTDKYDNRSSFSNYGPTSVDLGAPGSSVLSCEPGNRYQELSGTSMSTPHVSGACALIWSAGPALSHLDVKDIILDTVDQIPSLAGLCVSHGRLNLHKAIAGVSTWLDFDPPSGVIPPDDINDVSVFFDGNQAPGTYEGEILISSNDPFTPDMNIPVTLHVQPVDYFTELFNDNPVDMANKTLIFIPDDSTDYYAVCINEASTFPVDPAGSTIVSLDDDDYCPVHLNNQKVNLYGRDYDAFYIGSNGYVSFVSGDIRHIEKLSDHFELPRISALFDDLDPSAGGLVSWKYTGNSVIVTFENVPEYSLSNSNNFQIEMCFDGRIRITWLNIDSQDGLVGLSSGEGLSEYFFESDLSEYGVCEFPYDLNGDFYVDFLDFAMFAEHWRDKCLVGGLETVRDEFETASYSNNDGSQNWSSDWQELGESDGPTRGFIQVKDNQLQLGVEYRAFATIRSLSRQADLFGASIATLSYDYVAVNNHDGGYVRVQVSADGGLNWSTLAIHYYDAGSGSASFDITPYISSDTQIRFETAHEMKMYLYIDNVQIEYDGGSGGSTRCINCDFDQNLIIDIYDLCMFANNWLQ
ncbi:MAG: S8 family serine peptidase [Planctomycetota bacterium]|nr:MAG: S8 family serine peptidase [Planctomycetota bacterium]